jgi:hypothetical protein
MVPKALEHVDEVDHHVSQLVHGAGHVLDQHGGAGLTRRAHNGDEPLADIPEGLWQQAEGRREGKEEHGQRRVWRREDARGAVTHCSRTPTCCASSHIWGCLLTTPFVSSKEGLGVS